MRTASKRVGWLLALPVVVLAIGSSAVTAQAAEQPWAKLDPNTPIAKSSNGTVTRGSAPAKATGASILRGFEGTGDPADSGIDPADSGGPGTRTFDPAEPSIIFGPDDRTRITPTTAYPNRATVKIHSTRPDGSGYNCTGFLYDPDVVATSGHCVYMHENGVEGWHTDFVVTPAKDGSTEPYGSCEWTTASSVSGWIDDANSEYDYGAVKLDCSIGDTVGWFGIRWQSDSYDGTMTTLTGYPGDKSPTDSMWTDTDPISGSEDRRLLYKTDTAAGQSGAAVYIPGCETYCGIAVHRGPTGDQSNNFGRRINEAAFNNYGSWR